MEISATQVKDLREKTGLGMMICKQALIDTNGDMAKAIDNLRKQGQVTAAKRAGKAAKEGAVTIVTDATSAIVYEVNSETDFVARNEDFVGLVAKLGTILLKEKPANIDEAKKLMMPDCNCTVETRVTELMGKIGENISFRRYYKIDINPANERVAIYVHLNGKIGVVIKLHVEPASGLTSDVVGTLGKDLAMQIAASNPIAPNRESIPAEIIAKEKEIYFTQAQTSGKPEKIWDKIVEGKLVKFYQEMVLTEQAYIRDPAITVSDRIQTAEKEAGVSVKPVCFIRVERGAEEEKSS